MILGLANAKSSKSMTTSPASPDTLPSPERSFPSKGSLDSHEKNRTHLRPHLRRHHVRPYGRLASPRRQDRLRPQHGSPLHHHGVAVPANLLLHPQLPPQHPHHPRLLRPHVGAPLLQLHPPLHGQLVRRADSQGPVRKP